MSVFHAELSSETARICFALSRENEGRRLLITHDGWAVAMTSAGGHSAAAADSFGLSAISRVDQRKLTRELSSASQGRCIICI